VDSLTRVVDTDNRQRLDGETADRARRHQALLQQSDRPYGHPNPVTAPADRSMATTAGRGVYGREPYRVLPPTEGPDRSM
jgi:hypothetical protein